MRGNTVLYKELSSNRTAAPSQSIPYQHTLAPPQEGLDVLEVFSVSGVVVVVVVVSVVVAVRKWW